MMTLSDYQAGKRNTLADPIKSIYQNVQTFDCDKCQFTCAKESELQAHVLSVHLECQICDYKTSNNADLNRHLKDKHGNDVQVCLMKCQFCQLRLWITLSSDVMSAGWTMAMSVFHKILWMSSRKWSFSLTWGFEPCKN